MEVRRFRISIVFVVNTSNFNPNFVEKISQAPHQISLRFYNFTTSHSNYFLQLHQKHQANSLYL